MKPSSLPTRSPVEAWLIRTFERPGLVRVLPLMAVALCVPSVFLGFHLDDCVARYIYSDLPGAHRLLSVYRGGFGLANGIPSDNHWQIEAGYAPWWIYDQLRLALFRPISTFSLMLDMRLWPSSAFLMHAHSLAWLALFVLMTGRLYRAVLAPAAAGLAATLLAFDHTHGFEVGYIANRYALLTATFGVMALDQHVRSRTQEGSLGRWLGPLFYVLALLCGESALSAAAYVFAYALLCETGPWLRRALSCWPYAVLTVLWRAGYNLAGYGATGSGPYVDPAREPLHFFTLLLERGPILLLGQFFGPPAEVYTVASPHAARLMLVAALVLGALLVPIFWPLLRRDRCARFFAVGALCSLVPAAGTYPHNRSLIFASIGALALLAQLWQLYAVELYGAALSVGQLFSSKLGGVVLGGHLLLSPLLLPFASCGVVLLSPIQHAGDDVGDEVAGRDVVFVTAPDYLAVKVVQIVKRVEHKPLPRRWRALSFGPQRVGVMRTDDRTLELDYEGGILGSPFMELYRDRRLPMQVGERVELVGLSIEVLALTPDGRAQRARFRFDRPLEADSFRHYYYDGSRFVPWTPPAIGAHALLPGAQFKWGFD
ncbi:MAG: hypothetical protein ACHQ53_06600 [Polyangiales bacterium]